MELLQRAVADCPRFVSGTHHTVCVAGNPWRLCCRSGGTLSQICEWCVLQGSLEALLQRAVADCPRFMSGPHHMVCTAGNPLRHCCKERWPTVPDL